jgi:tetratricopeptide (TPR) repeat protein
MKSHLAIVFISVCTAIVLSFAFIPGETEIALMNFKEKKYDAAHKIYARRLSEGDWSVSTVMPLIQIYSYSGYILTAIEILERYIKLNPDNLEALTLIGTLYKDAQLSSKYLHNLERLMQIDPNEQGLRELSGLYAYSSQPEKRINVLRKLIEHYEHDANDIFGLAYLLARQGQRAEAAQILIRANLEESEKLDMKARKTLLSLLLKLNRMADVHHITKAWIELNGSVEMDIAYYGDWLLSQGYADPAFRLVQQLADLNDSAESLRLLFIRTALESGHREIALSQLKSWRRKGQLTKNLFSLFLGETLATGEFEAALQDVQWWFDLQQTPDRLLFGLIRYAYLHGKLVSLDKILAVVDPELLNEQPVIAVEAAIARNERDSTLVWIKHAEQRTDLSLEEQIVLIYQLVRMDQLEQALTILRTLVHSPQFPEGVCRDLTKIFIDIERTYEGLSHFEVLRKTRPSAETQRCWAMLAVAEGQEEAVLRWMRDQRSIDDTMVRDIFIIAHNNAHHRLAFASAQRLFYMRPNKQHEYYLATALLEVDRVDEALLILENLVPADAVIEATYLKALKAAKEIEQLINYGLARLDSEKLDEESESVFIRALVDVEANEAVLPHLRRVVKEKTAEWALDYQDVLRKLNLNAEWHNYIMTRLRQEDLSAEERRQLAFGLLELGDKKTAIATFKQLVGNASTEKQHVQQLF